MKSNMERIDEAKRLVWERMLAAPLAGGPVPSTDFLEIGGRRRIGLGDGLTVAAVSIYPQETHVALQGDGAEYVVPLRMFGEDVAGRVADALEEAWEAVSRMCAAPEIVAYLKDETKGTRTWKGIAS